MAVLENLVADHAVPAAMPADDKEEKVDPPQEVPVKPKKKPRNTELESLLVNTKRKVRESQGPSDLFLQRDEEVVPCTAIDDPHVRTLITDDRTTKVLTNQCSVLIRPRLRSRS